MWALNTCGEPNEIEVTAAHGLFYRSGGEQRSYLCLLHGGRRGHGLGHPGRGTRRGPFNYTPMGDQFDFVWPPARTHHGAYVWCLPAYRNQRKHHPMNTTAPSRAQGECSAGGGVADSVCDFLAETDCLDKGACSTSLKGKCAPLVKNTFTTCKASCFASSHTDKVCSGCVYRPLTEAARRQTEWVVVLPQSVLSSVSPHASTRTHLARSRRLSLGSHASRRGTAMGRGVRACCAWVAHGSRLAAHRGSNGSFSSPLSYRLRRLQVPHRPAVRVQHAGPGAARHLHVLRLPGRDLCRGQHRQDAAARPALQPVQEAQRHGRRRRQGRQERQLSTAAVNWSWSRTRHRDSTTLLQTTIY